MIPKYSKATPKSTNVGPKLTPTNKKSTAIGSKGTPKGPNCFEKPKNN